MGLVGSGEQAKTQLLAACAVRQLDKVKVFSPTRANRERFAEEMTEKAGVEIVPVHSAEEAVRGSDIVTAATNTVDPVINGEWLEKGAFVNSIVGGDSYLSRHELDDAVIERADLIVVGFRKQIFLDKQAEIYPRIQRGLIKEEDLHELGELLTGQCRAARTMTRSSSSRTTPAWGSSSPPPPGSSTKPRARKASAPSSPPSCSSPTARARPTRRRSDNLEGLGATCHCDGFGNVAVP